MSKTATGMSREELAQRLLERAREDDGFRQLVLLHPQEACGHFGFHIPGSEEEHARGHSPVERMLSRGAFYRWYYKHVLGELRDPAEAADPLDHGTWENMEWDFEITKYRPA
ncbi:MAG TPA: hypothetical protein VMK12_28155 [Anaeromyxobacteraceae bacterium]|nr:hypothetical protein [Anaeromyxobacteraceae bacterium]